MKKTAFVLAAACLAAVGCDTKVTRTGSITLTGSAAIPLIDKSGAHAELVAGSAELTVQKGSKDGTIAIKVRQINRPEVNLEAPILGDIRSGNFTLRGSETGQPVDLISARTYAVTGPNQRWNTWEETGWERCMIEYSFDPCDENWTVAFHAPAGDLGAFASRTASRCNERRQQYFCQPIPRHEPNIPDYPRGGRGGRFERVLSTDPSSVKFD